MLCRNCGEYFNKDAKFCPVCGSQLMPDDADTNREQNVTISADKTFEDPQGAVPPPVRYQRPPEGYDNRNSVGNMPPSAPYGGAPYPAGSGFQPQGPDGMPPSGGKDGVNKTLIILICVLGTLIIACSVILFFVLNQNNSEGETEATTAPTATTEASQTTTQPSSANNITEVTEPTTAPDTTVRVPNVTGLSYEDAVKYLEAAGLEHEFTLVPDDKVQPNYVISQSPEADKPVEKGTKVTINVAKPSESPTRKPTEAPAPDDSGSTMYVIASQYVTLRDSATRTGREITKINRGEKVSYISSDGEFSYVSYNGTKGYILSEFLSKDKNDINSGSGNASLKNGDYLYCRASEFATLRSSTSTSSSALAKIYRDERVSYLGQSGDWYYVSYSGKTGYVLKSFFSPQADAPLNYNDY